MGAEMLRFPVERPLRSASGVLREGETVLSMTDQVQERYDDELSNLVLPHA